MLSFLSKKTGKGKKKNNDKSACTSQAVSQSQVVLTQSQGAENDANQGLANLTHYRPFLRELHIDACVLLFRNLALDPESEVS